MIINPGNIEKWCFDYFEGNLTVHEKIEFERFVLEHPEYHAEFEAWKEASTEADNDETPAYLGMEGLLVSVPFYATFAFRVTVGLLFVLALGTLSFYEFSYDRVAYNYTLRSNSVDLNWSPENHKLAIVKYVDYAYGDYEVQASNSISQTNASSKSSSYDLDMTISEVSNKQILSSEILDEDEKILGHEAISTEKSDFKPEESDLHYYEKNDISESTFFSLQNSEQSFKEDHKNLYEHLGIDESRYQFLNFNNSRVIGLGSKKNDSRSKSKKNKQDNHATITQSKQKNGKSGNSYKKKSKFFENLKNIELGFRNINDPISIAPNYNVIGYNPSLAGQLGITRIKLNVRNQWWDTEESVFKGSLYFDTYFEKIQAGIAYGTEYDLSQDGQQQINKHSITYAQKFNISRQSNISVGLTYEMTKGMNASDNVEMKEFVTGSPILSSTIDDEWKSNIGVSAWYSGKYFFGGFNVTNLLGNTFIATHEESTSYINNLNYSIQLGTDYKQSMFAKTVISPYIQYNKLGNQSDVWLGSVVRIKSIVLGGGVATSKSAKAMIGIQGNKFRLTVSSDYAKSALMDKFAFSHEVSMRILLGNKNNNWSRYEN